MNHDTINELRNKLDIVEVISSYIPLTKKGRNYFGLCPFHDDHSPSLSVSSEKQIYKCFVCGESGNVFNFVMNYEHLSFPETMNLLAKSIGMEINVNIKRENNKYEHLYETMEIANKFYQNNLYSKEGNRAREYLLERKLDNEIIKEFGIGLSLDKKDVLTNLLIGKGHSLEELNSIDLSNTNHDSYINRIMFPLNDQLGRVIGFSGRIYNQSNLNKYQNTKETVLFKKRELLFNYHRAKEEVRKSKSVIIMEGFMAVIRSYTIGVKNCVATMGTALSNEQALLIKKLSSNIILCYDGDKAGKNAILTSGEIFLKLNVNPSVIILNDGLDPDDYILKYGEDAFKKLVDNAIPFTDYKIKALKSNYDLNNIDDKMLYINKVLLEIKQENDTIKREIMLKNLASETNVWYNTLEKKLSEMLDNEKSTIKKEEIIVHKNKKDGYLKAMESLVYYMLNNTSVITIVDNSNVYIPNREIRLIINEIISYYNRYGTISEADFYSYLIDKKELIDVLKKILSVDYPILVDNELINANLQAIKNYNVALEIERLENLIKNEVSIDEQMKLMDKILNLKMKEGKSC